MSFVQQISSRTRIVDPRWYSAALIMEIEPPLLLSLITQRYLSRATNRSANYSLTLLDNLLRGRNFSVRLFRKLMHQ